MALRVSVLAIVSALAANACIHSQTSLPISIATQYGPVRGSRDATDVVAFKGIPYAAPPTGEHRWRPPAPPASWTERDATRFGPRCVQPPNFGRQTAAVPQPMSEDCLTLNIWTSAKSAPARLPVIVWLHGGNFTIGAGSMPAFDGTNLARRGIVVVTLNYRLGALGFLAHPDLSRESEHRVSGNYGLLDEIAALTWIHANIAAFGGDPASVTLMGQSAGATGVGDLLVSPLARGLFQRVIVESIGGSYANQASLAQAESEGATLVSDIAAFRLLAADEVIARLPQAPTVSPQTHYYPVVDNYVVPANPMALLAGGQAKMPMLIGHNSDEALFWARDLPTTAAGYREYVHGWFRPEFVDEIMARYPAAMDSDVPKAATRLTSDFKVVTPTILMARAASSGGPVYMYRFSRVSPSSRSTFGGAAHTTEIPYVFDNLPEDPAQAEASDHALSQEMAAAWVQFAKTGDPNGPGLSHWPIYHSPDYQLLEFGDAKAVGSNAGSPAVEFFQSRPAGSDHRGNGPS